MEIGCQFQKRWFPIWTLVPMSMSNGAQVKGSQNCTRRGKQKMSEEILIYCLIALQYFLFFGCEKPWKRENPAFLDWLNLSQKLEEKRDKLLSTSEIRVDIFYLSILSVFALWSVWNWLLIHPIMGIIWAVILIPYPAYIWVEYKFERNKP